MPSSLLPVVPGAPWPTDLAMGLLAWRGDDLPTSARFVEVLSRTGDHAEAAAKLFAALRRLDASSATALMADVVPDVGLGLGINDRLRRAAGLG